MGYLWHPMWRISFLTSYMIGGLSALMIVAGVAGLTFAIPYLRE